MQKTDKLAKETFEEPRKLRKFLKTLSKIYNTSYNNILLLISQKEDINFIASRDEFSKYKYNIRNGENPLKVIARIKTDKGINFKIEEVFDISQTDAIKSKNKHEKEYVDKMLKGICKRRGLYYDPNNQMLNIELIITDISQNSREKNKLQYSVDQYAMQTQMEINSTVYAIAKRFDINTRNYNLNSICKWSIDKDAKTLKESLKYMQKFTNYFVRDFETQEKIRKIENEKEEQGEME